MCGRTASSLGPGDVVKASRYTNRRTGRRESPRWRTNPGQSYRPSYNVAPGGTTPVIVSSKHFKDSPPEKETPATDCQPETDAEPERVIQPMRWGLVPSWHKGELKSFDLKTSNCRSDNMLSSRVYKGPLEKGRRCVIVVDGFYEWHTGKDKKQQPYFIYFPSEKKVEEGEKMPSPESGDVESVTKTNKAEGSKETEDEEWPRQKVLTMAGVFDICHPKDTEGEPFYTYSVITVDASDAMSYIHHRMPAILNTDEEVRQWLDFGDVPLKEAVDVIRPTTSITSHPVSSKVNNSRNNAPDLIEKVDPNKKPSPTGLTMWLKKGTEKKKDDEDESVEEPEPKRLKTD
ncbi:abasic site processing protein HMCES-like [Lineus longissimus]|uniref:abasic site processing protein HMCES-like n=1 Tax=Lineus longissimus TaxID=88925 RepID=UPI002B4EF5BD